MQEIQGAQTRSASLLGHIHAEEKAQDAFEYLLLVGGVAIAIVAAIIVMATSGTGIVSRVGNLITGVLS